jgi:hypothetical protein
MRCAWARTKIKHVHPDRRRRLRSASKSTSAFGTRSAVWAVVASVREEFFGWVFTARCTTELGGLTKQAGIPIRERRHKENQAVTPCTPVHLLTGSRWQWPEFSGLLCRPMAQLFRGQPTLYL